MCVGVILGRGWRRRLAFCVLQNAIYSQGEFRSHPPYGFVAFAFSKRRKGGFSYIIMFSHIFAQVYLILYTHGKGAVDGGGYRLSALAQKMYLYFGHFVYFV